MNGVGYLKNALFPYGSDLGMINIIEIGSNKA